MKLNVGSLLLLATCLLSGQLHAENRITINGKTFITRDGESARVFTTGSDDHDDDFARPRAPRVRTERKLLESTASPRPSSIETCINDVCKKFSCDGTIVIKNNKTTCKVRTAKLAPLPTPTPKHESFFKSYFDEMENGSGASR